MKMPFGKYRDVELEKLPRHYLQWLMRQAWLEGWLRDAVERTLSGDTTPEMPPQEWLQRDLAEAVDSTLNQERPPYRLSEDAQRLRWQEKELFCGDFSITVTNGLSELVHPNGEGIVWTDDEWAAQQICKLLNENKEVLEREGRSSQC